MKDFEPSDKELIYSARDDGLYWFAVQLQLANGDYVPASEKKLEPAMKVFVNTLGRPVRKPENVWRATQRNRGVASNSPRGSTKTEKAGDARQIGVVTFAQAYSSPPLIALALAWHKHVISQGSSVRA